MSIVETRYEVQSRWGSTHWDVEFGDPYYNSKRQALKVADRLKDQFGIENKNIRVIKYVTTAEIVK